MKKAFDIIYLKLKELSIDENILCKEFWFKIVRLRENFNEKAAWELFKSNIQWLIKSKVITHADIIQMFEDSELAEYGIYFEGLVVCKDDIVVGFGDCKISASGHSRVILFDQAEADCYDSTFATGYDKSKITLNDCVGEAFGKCQVIAKGYSKVELWEESFCIGKNYSYIIAHDISTVSKDIKVIVLRQ